MQRNEHSHGIGKEHPRSHEIQLFCVILFLAVWVLDSFILNLTTTLAKEIHIIFRLLVFVLLVIITYRLVMGSHRLVLDKVDLNNPKVVTEDVYALIRHPMYFAYIIGFLALIQLTMSLISIVPLIITLFLFNKIADYEENELIKIFGQEYIDYMKSVPRWIPNPFKFLKGR